MLQQNSSSAPVADWPTSAVPQEPQALSRIGRGKIPSGAFRWFVWGAIAGGIVLRLVPYLVNRSLWLDESMLALNIIHRSFAELLRPLDFNQGAPLGFLMMERLAVSLFGTGEYALRLFPLVCGVVSLFLFYRLSERCLSPKARLVGISLFAVTGPLIYYSSEVKPYANDVGVAILLSLAAMHYLPRKLTARRLAVLGFVGAASIWFSHPAVFVLAGIAVTFLFFGTEAQERNARMARLGVLFSLWGASFAVCYFLVLRHLSSNQSLLIDWSAAFVPWPFLSVDAAKWFAITFVDVFRSPLGLALGGLAALCLAAGGAFMFSRKRKELCVLLLPVCFTLIAAALHKYPFSGRMILFTVPALVPLIAEGAEQIRRQIAGKSAFAGACVIGLLFVHPVLFSTYHVFRPNAESLPLGVDAAGVPAGVGHTREEIRPVMEYIRQHRQAGDVLYVFDAAKPAFLYYAPKYHLDEMDHVFGHAWGWTQHWEDYESDFDQLSGKGRVWLLFSHLHDQEKFLVFLADKRGIKLDAFKSVGAEVYLYHFDDNQPKLASESASR